MQNYIFFPQVTTVYLLFCIFADKFDIKPDRYIISYHLIEHSII